jgi:hypothetical protein
MALVEIGTGTIRTRVVRVDKATIESIRSVINGMTPCVSETKLQATNASPH